MTLFGSRRIPRRQLSDLQSTSKSDNALYRYRLNRKTKNKIARASRKANRK